MLKLKNCPTSIQRIIKHTISHIPFISFQMRWWIYHAKSRKEIAHLYQLF